MAKKKKEVELKEVSRTEVMVQLLSSTKMAQSKSFRLRLP